MKTEVETGEHHVPLSVFVIAMAAQLAGAIALFAFLAPAAFKAEIQQPFAILGIAIGLGIPLSLFEYFYHRYLLHSAILPFVGAMHRAHSNHHNLTYVKAPVLPNEPARLVEVSSEFPVVEPHQEESMMFPLWCLLAFFAVFMVLLGWPLKALFPNQPVLLSVILAVTAYYCSYEGWHAILHLPYERFWQPLIEGPKANAVVKRMYSFHLMHHWRPTSNLAIVGFWGIALWDHAFRTHRRPERLPVHGAEVNYHDAELRKPTWPVSQIDRVQGRMYKASRKFEQFLAKLFSRKAA